MPTLTKPELTTELAKGNISVQPQPAPIINGYGSCSISDCYCGAFAGNGGTCSNCGHSYSKHW